LDGKIASEKERWGEFQIEKRKWQVSDKWIQREKWHGRLDTQGKKATSWGKVEGLARTGHGLPVREEGETNRIQGETWKGGQRGWRSYSSLGEEN